MRDLVVTENITLDGDIDASGGWFAAVFLVGRQTYEDMRGYWPLQTGDTTGVSGYLNQVHKYVVSSTLIETRPFDNGVLLLRYRGRARN